MANSLIRALVLTISILHAYFLMLEMFLWTHPIGRRTFGITPEFARESKTLAANQGLYNGFLSSGLLWAALAPQTLAGPLRLFFLGCVLVAGIFGGLTVNRRIFFVQGLPALVALVLVWIAARAG